MNPRYSIIVPAYNAASTIEECLKALVNQSVPHDLYEVIVVDDGSTDGTGDVAERYPFQVLRRPHTGPGGARNFGAEVAVGLYLLFTDADCVPIHSWIEEIVRPLEVDDKVAAAKGVYRTHQTNLIARFCQVEFEEKYARMRRQQQIDFVDTYSAAFRRDAFWEGGAFDPAFSALANEDTQLSFNLASQGQKLVFAEKAVVYHRHPESLRHYLLRKWRYGYWRVPVYRRHPRKMTGDSNTPRSTQFQFVAAALTVAAAPFPTLRVYALAAWLLFVLAALPFVRRGLSVGWDVALAVPFILFLRAAALGAGLIAGALMLPLAHQQSNRVSLHPADSHRKVDRTTDD